MQMIKSDTKRYLERNSGIELLKIIAIFLIVISHVVRALRAESFGLYSHEYFINFNVASADIRYIVLMLFSYLGMLGNTVFFVCSAWFLLNSSKYSKRKWFAMLFEIWFVSVFILAVTLIIRHGSISPRIILSSLMPTTFSNNWYLTCYLLFYPIHPLLNIVIQKLDKRNHLRLACAMLILYCGFGFLKEDLFFD